jgi:hypothetical protein
MNQERLRKILSAVSRGEVDVESALDSLKRLPFEDIGFARIDHHRGIRRGAPEVVFCRNKTVAQVVEISSRILAEEDDLILTHATGEMYAALAEIDDRVVYHEDARMITRRRPGRARRRGWITVLSAGTSDIPVAEEARVTAEALGNRVSVRYDVGVAGIHRLFSAGEEIRRARVVVVVAGMEGALASVVGGMIDRPVIAVPTSVGYGASFGGVAALLAMLNSCASGVTVVNIDNGFGAGYAASQINQLPAGRSTGRGPSRPRGRGAGPGA